MTSNAAGGDRILGSLRSADGKGIVRMETATTSISTTCGRHSPTRAVSPAGTARSRATFASAVSSTCAFPASGKAQGAWTRASRRGGCC